MQAQLEIRALGGLTVHSEATTITFETHKDAALLVYLACTGRTHPREALAEMLWEDRTQSQALANLRHVLTQLRQRVDPYVTISRQSVAMNPDSEWWLDVTDFERQLDAAGDQGLSGLARARLSQLLIYLGSPLVALGFVAWDGRLALLSAHDAT